MGVTNIMDFTFLFIKYLRMQLLSNEPVYLITLKSDLEAIEIIY